MGANVQFFKKNPHICIKNNHKRLTNGIVNIAKWDSTDFQSFIKENAAAFHVFVSRYIKDEDTMNDILQESFIKLWTNREKIGEVRSLRSYCFSIIKNTIFDHWQKASKERVEDVFRNYEYLADEDIFFRNMVEVESSRIIAQAIKTLSPQSQKVILMTLKGEKIKGIAQALKISENTVKTIKYRALERLSGLLSKEDLLG